MVSWAHQHNRKTNASVTIRTAINRFSSKKKNICNMDLELPKFDTWMMEPQLKWKERLETSLIHCISDYPKRTPDLFPPF